METMPDMATELLRLVREDHSDAEPICKLGERLARAILQERQDVGTGSPDGPNVHDCDHASWCGFCRARVDMLREPFFEVKIYRPPSSDPMRRPVRTLLAVFTFRAPSKEAIRKIIHDSYEVEVVQESYRAYGCLPKPYRDGTA